MSASELIIGYGSLVSKKGITREGSAPRIHRAWAVLVPGRRGFSKTFRNGRKVVLDAFLDEAKVIDARPLIGFLEGPASPPRDVWPDMEEQPVFEGMALEIDRDDWDWFDAREEFPAGLGAALAKERDDRGMSIGAILSETMARSGLEGFPRALFDRYKDHLRDPEWPAFAPHYIPYPLRLPDVDALGARMPHAWGIICAVPDKELPHQKAGEAAAGPGVDASELLWYYHDCMLGSVHGLLVDDLRDPGFEATHPELETMLAHHREDESRPLSWFLGNLPKGALPSSDRGDERHRMRPLEDLVPLSDALVLLDALDLPRMRTETYPLDGADGRVLAEDVLAAVEVPGFDKSAMDGYAVRAEDTYGASLHAPRGLRVAGTQHAGPLRASDELLTGTCVQIATGAPLPQGADAVVMVEATTREGDDVRVHRPHARGQNVVARGSDIARGAVVARRGTRLDPVRLAALAAVGVSDLQLLARPRVAVVSTGDEVVPPGRALGPGQVHDANNHALAALCRRLGTEVTRIAGIADTHEEIEAVLDQALEEHELVLFTGGTSAGERDLLPGILQARGEVLFHGLKVRPGKPVVAAVVAGRPVIGLPGYPTSCLLVAERLVAPLIDRLGGATQYVPAAIVETRAVTRINGTRGWCQWVPVRLTAEGAVPCFRGSAAITSLSAADGYVELDEETEEVEAGARVRVHRFR